MPKKTKTRPRNADGLSMVLYLTVTLLLLAAERKTGEAEEEQKSARGLRDNGCSHCKACVIAIRAESTARAGAPRDHIEAGRVITIHVNTVEAGGRDSTRKPRAALE